MSWKLAEMPLPRLQPVGPVDARLLDDLGWDDTIAQSQFEREGFDRSVRLRAGDGRQLTGEADVDLLVPWSRSQLNAITNLVLADRRVNNRKRDHLAAAPLAER